MKRSAFFSAKNVAYLAVLTALVVVLQTIALVTGIFMPTSLSFVLIPIVVGAVLMGPLAGAILGFMFGLMTVIFGVTGADEFTFLLFSEHPFLTLLTCFVKATVAGVVPGLLFRLLEKKNRYVAVFVASASAPILNTGIFVLGAMTMWQTFENFAAGANVMYFIIVTCALINFLIEFFTTIVVAPVIWRVEAVVNKRVVSRKQEKTASAEPQEDTANDSVTDSAKDSKEEQDL